MRAAGPSTVAGIPHPCPARPQHEPRMARRIHPRWCGCTGEPPCTDSPLCAIEAVLANGSNKRLNSPESRQARWLLPSRMAQCRASPHSVRGEHWLGLDAANEQADRPQNAHTGRRPSSDPRTVDLDQAQGRDPDQPGKRKGAQLPVPLGGCESLVAGVGFEPTASGL